MHPQPIVDLRRTDPFPFDATAEDPDMDVRATNPCVFDPAAEYAAGYFRKPDPMLRDPADEDTELDIDPRAGEPSLRVVFSSLFLLSGLGLGAFLLMYSGVHGGELHAAPVTTEDVPAAVATAATESQTATMVAASPQPETPVALAPLAPAPTPEATATAAAPPVVDPVVPTAATTTTAVTTLAPLPTVLLTEAPTQAPAAVPVRRAATAPSEPVVRAVANTNPYDDKPAATPPSSIGASRKPAVVIRVEPNPVTNPYAGATEEPTKSPSAE